MAIRPVALPGMPERLSPSVQPKGSEENGFLNVTLLFPEYDIVYIKEFNQVALHFTPGLFHNAAGIMR